MKNCKTSAENRVHGFISVPEMKQALQYWLRSAQELEFSAELNDLRQNTVLKSTSTLKNLNPFLDSAGLLRVGGRLSRSDLPYDHKHPIILPKRHHLTLLIVRREHILNLHSGLNVTMAVLRGRYWIIHGRSTVKRIIHQCVRCYRFRPLKSEQLMADLPPSRITASKPFRQCGVDYAGPFTTRLPRGRTRVYTKSYLALFVCLVTKAVHLEVVSDLSTEAFLATLRRFVSRRGYPSIIMSDNGTNFVGANNTLRELYTFLRSTHVQDKVSGYCLQREMTWQFIPPAAPHIGGLWEANIKSCKSILKRITGHQVYTHEELETLFCQIEAILNSRPLCAMSMDSSDYSALTPGHFLIGEPLLAVPSLDYLTIPCNRLNRWKLLQQQQQQFWRQWSSEYLNTLQQRLKWRTPQSNLQVDDLVVVKDDNTSPLQWTLARVIATHPSAHDNLVRVVTIRTANSTYKRPITKLLKLPLES